MQVVQTAGAPPNHGSSLLARMSWTWNNRKAPRKTAMPKRAGAGLMRRLAARHLPEHAQEVSSEDLPDVALAVPSPEQGRGQGRHLRDILQPRRHGVDAVPVTADADVVDAPDLARVIDVGQPVLQGCGGGLHLVVLSRVLGGRELVQGPAGEGRLRRDRLPDPPPQRLGVLRSE